MIKEKTWKGRNNYVNTNKEIRNIDNKEAKMQNRRDSFHNNFHPTIRTQQTDTEINTDSI